MELKYEDLYVGARVLVGDGSDLTPSMKKFVNTEVTISALYHPTDIRILEDPDGSTWYLTDFARLVEEFNIEDVGGVIGFCAEFAPGGVTYG